MRRKVECVCDWKEVVAALRRRMLDAFGGSRRERLGLVPVGTILWFGVECQIR